MSKKQKESLLDDTGLPEIEIETLLDTMRPEGIRKFRNFGNAYVDEMRRVHGLPVVSDRTSLLDPEVSTDDLTAEVYKRQPTTYHPQDDGSVDVRITLSLTPNVARWLEGLELRLPEMYALEPTKQNISYHVGQRLLETMRIDSERHGSLGEGAAGTLSRSEHNGKYSAGGLNNHTIPFTPKTYT